VVLNRSLIAAASRAAASLRLGLLSESPIPAIASAISLQAIWAAALSPIYIWGIRILYGATTGVVGRMTGGGRTFFDGIQKVSEGAFGFDLFGEKLPSPTETLGEGVLVLVVDGDVEI